MTDETTASLVAGIQNLARMSDDGYLRKASLKAADALEAQAVRIAELNAEVLQFHSAYEVAHGQAMANGDACKDAESQRDTALAEVASLKEPAQDAIEILDVAIDLWNEVYPCEPDEVFTDLQRRFRELTKSEGVSQDG